MLLIRRYIDKALIPVFAAALCLALGACATTVQVEPIRLPEPLVTTLPLSVAARYPESMIDFVYEETLPSGDQITFEIGRATQTMLATTLAKMFSQYQELPLDAQPDRDIDLLIEPSIAALEFALPSQNVSKDYSVWVKYRIKVFDRQGLLQADFPLAAYGKTAPTSAVGGRAKALKLAAGLALRDAAVLLLTGFAEDAKLADHQLASSSASQARELTIDSTEITNPGAETQAAPQRAMEQSADDAQSEQFL